jgi:hypothetical protein
MMPGQRVAGEGSDPMSQIVKVLEDAGTPPSSRPTGPCVPPPCAWLGERLSLRVALAT